MAGLIEECKAPSPCLNPNSKRGGMATHAGVALELGITRPHGGGAKMMSPQMEAILIWCQCRTREYDNVKIDNFTTLSPSNRKSNYELAFQTGERFAGIPDFLTAENMEGMVADKRIDPKMIFSYVQEVYRMCNEL